MNANQTKMRLLLTAREAADALAISMRTLYTLTKTGQLAAVRIGRGVRYAKDDLEKFIASQRTHSLESTSESEAEERLEQNG